MPQDPLDKAIFETYSGVQNREFHESNASSVGIFLLSDSYDEYLITLSHHARPTETLLEDTDGLDAPPPPPPPPSNHFEGRW